MKKIALDEEFSAVGGIYIFTNKEGKIVLQRVRNAGKTKEFIPPTLEEVKDYFKKEGYKEEVAIRAFNHYAKGNWHNSQGKKVKNWQQTMYTNWMKEENKIKEQPAAAKEKEGKFMF